MRKSGSPVRLRFLSEDPGWLRRFCQEYELEGIRLDEESIHGLADAAGRSLGEIRFAEAPVG